MTRKPADESPITEKIYGKNGWIAHFRKYNKWWFFCAAPPSYEGPFTKAAAMKRLEQ